MIFKSLTVNPELRSVVKSAWTLQSASTAVGLKQFRTMADGCPGFIYQHPDDGAFYQDDKLLAEAFVFGQTTRHAHIGLSGKFNAIGMHLQPNALRSVFNCNPEGLTDSCVDISSLAKRQGSALSEKLANTAGVDNKVEMITSFLVEQARRNHRVKDSVMQYALAQILRSDGKISLKALQENLQLSERSFQRNFKNYTGIAPKLFSRICRFQASLKQLQVAEYNKLSDIAFDHEYSDQSHFIRSFKEFAGFSPHQYQKQTSEVVENLTAII